MVDRESCPTLRSEQATRCTERQDRNGHRNTHQTRNEHTEQIRGKTKRRKSGQMS